MNGDAPVTRTELKAELATLKAELATFNSELKSELVEVEKRIIEYVDERTRDLQTELLRAFVDYSNSATVRFRKLEADVSNVDTSTTQRLGELERQMADVRARLIALEGHRRLQ